MVDPIADHQSSIEFLERFHPDRLWVVTAIPPNKKKIETRTFAKGGIDRLVDWLGYHENDNIYFSVAEPVKPLEKKAERTDIKTVHWLHVDLDPRAGEDIEEERERILKTLQSPPDEIPEPTVIVFSGGGYQGFWRLEEPIPIEGDMDKAEQAKRYNMQIELRLGGDQCHNVDRIMRLPGTVNWPDKRKKEKGRVPELATFIKGSGKTYPISMFTQAPVVQNGSGFDSKKIKVSSNVARIDDVNQLPVDDLCKVVIVQGFDPDDSTRFEKKSSPGELDRSTALFWVICKMVRAGCDDDTIFSVITDSGFGISGHILAQKSNVERFALRQIERAREKAVDPWLMKLNDRYAVIGSYGGKCRIITEQETVIENVRRKSVDFLSFGDFTNFWCNRFVKVGDDKKSGKPILMPVGKWWIKHRDRRQFDTVVFAPEIEVDGAYNLWKGFAFNATPGDCSIYLDHVKRNICGGDEDIYKYVIGWMAAAVQYPARPGHTAIVLRGLQGTGKGMFAENFGALFGRHFLPVRDSNHIFGQFNFHLMDCVVLFADEAIWTGNQKHESLLKSLITQETVMTESKGINAGPSTNCVHLIMASNNEWVVPARADDRRLLVLDIHDNNRNDRPFFNSLKEQLKAGGYEALLHFLRSYDLSEFNVQNIPQTSALQEQKIHTFSSQEEWWYTKLQKGRMYDDQEGWPEYVFSSHVCYDYISYHKLWGTTTRTNETKLGRFFSKAFPEGFKIKRQLGGEHHVFGIDGIARDVKRPYVYMIPSLEQCRQVWDDLYGGPYDWSEVPKYEDK